MNDEPSVRQLDKALRPDERRKVTDHVFRLMREEEALARHKKSERLRQERLKAERSRNAPKDMA